MPALVTTDPTVGLTAADADWLRARTASITKLWQRTAETIIEAGLIISEVKERLGHGSYLAWVAECLPFSADTATRFQRVAEQFAPHGTWIPQLAEFEPSALYMLTEPKVPTEARDLAIKLAIEGHKIDRSAARNIIKQVSPEPAAASAQQPGSTHAPNADKSIGASIRVLLAVASRLTLETSHDPDGDPIITATYDGPDRDPDVSSGRDVAEVLALIVERMEDDTETDAPFAIDPTPHIDWAKAVARGVAGEYEFPAGSQERSDVEAVAVAELTAACKRFDPARVPVNGDAGGLLRGYAHQSIQKECRREAVRLRNGGTFNTRRDGHAPVVVGSYSEDEGE